VTSDNRIDDAAVLLAYRDKVEYLGTFCGSGRELLLQVLVAKNGPNRIMKLCNVFRSGEKTVFTIGDRFGDSGDV
jgi:hypothetical protein